MLLPPGNRRNEGVIGSRYVITSFRSPFFLPVHEYHVSVKPSGNYFPTDDGHWSVFFGGGGKGVEGAHLFLYVVGNNCTRSKFKTDPATWLASKVSSQ